MTPDSAERLRQLPSVDQVLAWPEAAALSARYGRALVVEGIRQTISAERQTLRAQPNAISRPESLLPALRAWLEAWLSPSLQSLINATGVIIHTNLGRAPLSLAAVQAIAETAAAYSNLEYDLARGERGSRAVHAAAALTRLTGAEAAIVVNNNAAAVLLMLTALCQGREVLISRGQLVEIGGGFRVPDVMAQSGAQLVEVGATNRTHLRDYEQAISPRTAAILVAHASNFKMVGFTSQPALAELAELAHAHGLWLLYDQGSGALLDTSRYGLEKEPMVQEAIAAGCDVVTFSGDKLLGGPQAGIAGGARAPLEQMARHPLARAVRPDKLCLAALAATLAAYLRGAATQEIPVWQMISRSEEELALIAGRWVDCLTAQGIPAGVVASHSTVGGGSLPGEQLPTCAVALRTANPDALAARLRAGEVKVIGRIQQDQLRLDPRTVLPEQEAALLRAVQAGWAAEMRPTAI